MARGVPLSGHPVREREVCRLAEVIEFDGKMKVWDEYLEKVWRDIESRK